MEAALVQGGSRRVGHGAFKSGNDFGQSIEHMLHLAYSLGDASKLLIKSKLASATFPVFQRDFERILLI